MTHQINNSHLTPSFWRGKKVFITGHTGFKGSWLCLWLKHLGAELAGFSLAPSKQPSMHKLLRLDALVNERIADVRDLDDLRAALVEAQPDIVFHLAAQPLVRLSYESPVETFSINTMGSIHLLEAAKECPKIQSIVMVTSDKCYENREWLWGYRESDAMGGYDPYSASKGAAEIAISGYTQSYFRNTKTAVASARAGNVIGGGDWSLDRLVPDMVKAVMLGEPLEIRNPYAIRPWQHVLEPLAGYMRLAEQLYLHGQDFSGGWNFGPNDGDNQNVEKVAALLCMHWGEGAAYDKANVDACNLHEAAVLKLDCSKARAHLQWYPKWSLDEAVCKTVAWYKAYQKEQDLYEVSLEQIEQYTSQ